MSVTEISPWIILIASIFTANILLANFLGMCSFLVCSKQLNTAVGLGVAVIFVMTFTAAINHWIYYHVLISAADAAKLGLPAPLIPADLTVLSFIISIAVIAAFVQFVEMFVERFSQPLYHALGIFLPLITVNCAILGASLFMIVRHYTFWQSVAFGFGGGVGWALAILLMAGLRQKLGYSHIPRPFRGVSLIMILTGIMAMVFMGFAGMVRIQ